ncbi:MAG: hypothetical protein WBQ09_19405 [Terriglobales bacterium]|jgi:hypothetical protein
MDRTNTLAAILALSLIGVAAPAQQSATAPAPNIATVHGCLRGQRGNYILIEDNTGAVYVLKGVGNKLDKQRRHQVEVKGTILPGSIKTGVRPEKSGSNPSDTVHGVDGVPLQVANVDTDVRTLSNRCQAADKE